MVLRYSLLLAMLAGTSVPLYAQCSVSLQVNPPYSPYLNDYVQRANQLVLSIDHQGSNQRTIYIQLILRSQNGIEIRTKNGFKPATPFTVMPQRTHTFTGSQLSALVDIDQLDFSGVSKELVMRTGQLPEGNYQFCAQVFDYQTSQPLSQQAPVGCSNPFTILVFDPPVITMPSTNAVLNEYQAQQLRISWMLPRSPTSPVYYRLRIAEIRGSQSPYDALHNTTDLHLDKTVSGISYDYLPSDKKMENGKRYGITVTASTTTGDVFRNLGESDIVTVKFEFGNNNPSPDTGAKVTTNEAQVPRLMTRKKIDTVYMPVIKPPDSSEIQICNIIIVKHAAPALNGGLEPKSLISNRKIERDELIPLKAIADDYDIIEWNCIPGLSCPPPSGKMQKVLAGRQRFEWKINEGDGNFTKLGFLPVKVRTDAADIVIFQPPYVPLSERESEERETVIILTIHDDAPTQIIDDSAVCKITVKTVRKKKEPDVYYVTVTCDTFSLPKQPKPVFNEGTCMPSGGWTPGKGFAERQTVILPKISANDTIFPGQLIVLEAQDDRETDDLKMICSAPNCGTVTKGLSFEDYVDWSWSVSGGGTIIGSPGRFVIYQAPPKIDGRTKDVTITVTATNTKGVQPADGESKGKITLHLYAPALRLEYPPLSWLPKAGDSIRIRSVLMYANEKRQWQTAPSHYRRIHFFALDSVSHEPGVANNAPHTSKATICADLSFTDGDEREAFDLDKYVYKVTRNDDTKITRCNDTTFLRARTKRPEQPSLVTLSCNDYAARAYLASYMSAKFPVVPIPWKRTDHEIAHPFGRPLTREFKDNRVTIPRDIDRNAIADGGWVGRTKKFDDNFKNNAEDIDPKPDGDGAGDGFTVYEEYRGFMTADGKHVRLNPEEKDLFVYNPSELPLETFAAISKVSVHAIGEEQLLDTLKPIVNFNRYETLPNGIDQHALLLYDRSPGKGYMGYAYRNDGKEGADVPNLMKYIYVSRANIDSFCNIHPVDNAEKLKQIVAHELSHGCSIKHHGERFHENYSLPHGPRSGDKSCIMRYDNWDAILEKIGWTYCSDPTGSGESTFDPRFGKAKVGNCISQLRISGRVK